MTRAGLTIGVDGYPVSGRRTGIGRYTAELVKAAVRRGPGSRFEVVLFGHHPQGPPQAEDLAEAGAHLRTTSGPAAFAFRAGLKLGLPVPFRLLVPRADVLVYTNFRWYHPAGLPALTFVYDLGYLHHPEFAPPGWLDQLRAHATQAIARSDRIGVISETMAGELADAYPQARERLVVLPPAPTAGQGLDEAEAGARRARLGLAAGYLLHVGTVEPRKNLTALVRAVGLLPPGQVLVLVGNRGWKDEAILAAVEAAGERVRRLPFLDDADLEAVYRGAAMFVYPSHYEGFGLPLVEAMAHGLPVVCSDLAVFREVAGPDARFVDHRDPAAIAGAVEALLDDQDARATLAAAGPTRAARYSWAASADRLLETLSVLAG